MRPGSVINGKSVVGIEDGTVTPTGFRDPEGSTAFTQESAVYVRTVSTDAGLQTPVLR